MLGVHTLMVPSMRTEIRARTRTHLSSDRARERGQLPRAEQRRAECGGRHAAAERLLHHVVRSLEGLHYNA
jgi:hypothetical protein